ncbi:deoxyribonuclease, partial [Gardnerella vaginalis]
MQYDHNTHYSSNPISKRIASFIWLISLAIIIGIVIGLVLPKINHDVGEITGEYAADGDAAALLNKLKVSKS